MPTPLPIQPSSHYIAFTTLSRTLLERDIKSIMWSMVYPLNSLITLYILSIWSPNDAMLQFWAIGLWFSLLCQKSFFSTAYNFLHFKLTHSIEDFIVTPINGGVITQSLCVYAVVTNIFYSILYLLCLKALNIHIDIMAAIYAFIMVIPLLCLFSIIGFISALWAKRWDNLAVIELFMLYPAIFLSGVFFHRHALNEAWLPLFDSNLLGYYVTSMRHINNGNYHDINWNVMVLGLVITIII